MNTHFLFILFFCLNLASLAQDRSYVYRIVDTLSSESMHGRGYVKSGERLAALFIRNEFIHSGLKCFGEDYFQPFDLSINTFRDTIRVSIDTSPLNPGSDYVLLSSSPSVSGTFGITWQLADSAGRFPDSAIASTEDLSDKVVITNLDQKDFEKRNAFGSKGVIFLRDEKVWWHVSNGSWVNDFFQLQVVKNKIPEEAETLTIYAKNTFIEKYPTQNVIAYVEGKSDPESFFVFTAHYDHLGMMGAETWFPGANDNASGTAMLLDLARYYARSENQPEISLVFMAFAAEETGLSGSEYYVANPLFSLDKIKFLVNLDMVGSGSEGIKVVNGSVFKKEFELLKTLNKENEYLLMVSERGEAANSDHYPFYTQGVPCFFIYTLGKECKEYHNIYDTPENVPFTEYDDVFRLLLNFQSFFY